MENNSMESESLLKMANDLLVRFGGKAYVKDIKECNHLYFIQIYETMLGETLPGLCKSSPSSIEEEIHNIQVVIDSLATDVLSIDLSHIDAQCIAKCSPVHIGHLLEIFDGLLEVVLEELDNDEHGNEVVQPKGKDTPPQRDYPSILSANHRTLSDVFQDEFSGVSPTNRSKRTFNEITSPGKDLSPNKLTAFQHDRIIMETTNMKIRTSAESDKLTMDSLTWSKHGKDSTDDLIKEADIVEQKSKSRNDKCAQDVYNADSAISKKSSPIEKSNCWSSILSQTSSAVERAADLNDIGKRPRRPLGIEKESQHLKEHDVQMHKHTHHHYYVNGKESPLLTTDSGSSCNSVPPLNLNDVASSYSDKSEKDLPCYDKNRRSVQLQTNAPILVNSSVQTETSKRVLTERFKNTDVDKPTSSEVSSYIESLPSHIQYLKRVNTEIPVTRSKHLSDLNERLEKLRGHINTSTLPEPTSEIQHIISKNDRKKERSKVSFAVSTFDKSRHVSLSDTEIDYHSPIHYKYRSSLSRSSPRKSILRKTLNIVSDDDSDDEDCEQTSSILLPSQNSRFEIPYLKRDERLIDIRRAMKKEEKQRGCEINHLRKKYSKQQLDYVQMKSKTKKQNNMQLKQSKKKKLHSEIPPVLHRRKDKDNTLAKRLASVYGRRGRDEKFKTRKRSASTSPISRRRRGKTPMVLKEDEILPIMEEEFPFIYLSPRTAKLMWQKQTQQVDHLRQVGTSYNKSSSKMKKRIEDAQNKQELLTNIMKKELAHNQRLKEYKDMKYNDTLVRRKLKERRQNAARARRYYDEYHIRNKAKMLKKRTKEEKIFKQLFEDGLEIQKQRLREMREYAREKKEKNTKKQENELASLENYYRDQFSMLAENVANERYELQVRQKAQSQTLHKMRSDMRRKMESDIKTIQDQLANEDDAISFRQLDADNLKREFQLATYKASKI